MRRSAVAGPPKACPVLGHIPHYLYDKLGFLTRCGRAGGAVQLELDRPTWLLTDPKDLRHVLLAGESKYSKLPSIVGRRGHRLFGKGLLNLAGDEHAARRRLLQPLFSPERLGDYLPAIHLSVDQMTAGWAPGAAIDITCQMRRLARIIILRLVFGVDYAGIRSRLADALAGRQAFLDRTIRSPLPWRGRWPTPGNLAAWRDSRLLDHTLRREIAARRRRPVPERSLLDRLLLLRDDEGVGLQPEEVRDEAAGLLLAGHETMGETLAWSLQLVAEQAAARAQTWDCPDIESVVAESLRLYPPTWLMVRIALRDDCLPSGARIRKGSKIYLSQWAVHRSPRLFEDPETFHPGRFKEDASPPGYFPFGGGARTCIGRPLALLEAALVIRLILQKGTLRPLSSAPVVPAPALNLRPKTPILLEWRPKHEL